ncbi:MAG: hypothetical protein JWP36_2122 [Paucimonas sp.]|nr:hypothetical protein [Paucimonas sp.]
MNNTTSLNASTTFSTTTPAATGNSLASTGATAASPKSGKTHVRTVSSPPRMKSERRQEVSAWRSAWNTAKAAICRQPALINDPVVRNALRNLELMMTIMPAHARNQQSVAALARQVEASTALPAPERAAILAKLAHMGSEIDQAPLLSSRDIPLGAQALPASPLNAAGPASPVTGTVWGEQDPQSLPPAWRTLRSAIMETSALHTTAIKQLVFDITLQLDGAIPNPGLLKDMDRKLRRHIDAALGTARPAHAGLDAALAAFSAHRATPGALFGWVAAPGAASIDVVSRKRTASMPAGAVAGKSVEFDAWTKLRRTLVTQTGLEDRKARELSQRFGAVLQKPLAQRQTAFAEVKQMLFDALPGGAAALKTPVHQALRTALTEFQARLQPVRPLPAQRVPQRLVVTPHQGLHPGRRQPPELQQLDSVRRKLFEEPNSASAAAPTNAPGTGADSNKG